MSGPGASMGISYIARHLASTRQCPPIRRTITSRNRPDDHPVARHLVQVHGRARDPESWQAPPEPKLSTAPLLWAFAFRLPVPKKKGVG